MWEKNHLLLFRASLEWLTQGTVNGTKDRDAQARIRRRGREPLNREPGTIEPLNPNQHPRTPAPPHPRTSSPRAGAVFVAAGILLSRLAGLVRLRVFAHYFGLQSDAADAFNAAFRIPNFLQNLFGEGALSASFIPVYARARSRGERKRGRPRGAARSARLLALVDVGARARSACSRRRC